jgi:hypothetical protein
MILYLAKFNGEMNESKFKFLPLQLAFVLRLRNLPNN